MNKASQFSKLNFFDTELNKTKLKSFVGSLSVFCITLSHCTVFFPRELHSFAHRAMYVNRTMQ